MKTRGAVLWAAAIEEQGETQQSAAEAIDVHPTHASKVLLGRRLPGRRMAWDIWQRYGVPVEAWDEPAASGDAESAA
jgi:plasmid maintenance system antidote protein VapI